MSGNCWTIIALLTGLVIYYRRKARERTEERHGTEQTD